MEFDEQQLQAYQHYANKHEKLVSELTESEKRQACIDMHEDWLERKRRFVEGKDKLLIFYRLQFL